MPTKIEWAEESWNPVIGCSKVSPGCTNCYAERLANRLRHMEKNKPGEKRHYTKVVAPGGWNGNIHLIPDRLDQPLHWKKPRRIFVCSMGDLFHEKVSTEFQADVFNTICSWKKTCRKKDCSHEDVDCWRDPGHQYLILTKRPRTMRHAIATGIPEYAGEYFPGDSAISIQMENQWPPENVWFGVSAEDQKTADERIPILLDIPAAKHFVSVEPMLEHIDLMLDLKTKDQPHIEWVIVGAESGPGARWCNRDYMIQVVNQCKSAGVPVFVKQIHIAGTILSKNMDEWPEDLRVREYPC